MNNEWQTISFLSETRFCHFRFVQCRCRCERTEAKNDEFSLFVFCSLSFFIWFFLPRSIQYFFARLTACSDSLFIPKGKFFFAVRIRWSYTLSLSLSVASSAILSLSLSQCVCNSVNEHRTRGRLYRKWFSPLFFSLSLFTLHDFLRWLHRCRCQHQHHRHQVIIILEAVSSVCNDQIPKKLRDVYASSCDSSKCW